MACSAFCKSFRLLIPADAPCPRFSRGSSLHGLLFPTSLDAFPLGVGLLVGLGSLRQGREGRPEDPTPLALLGQDEVLRNNLRTITAAGAQPQRMAQHGGGAAGLEAAEAQLVRHQEGLRQDSTERGAHKNLGSPAINALKGRVDGHHNALVIREHEGLVAALKFINGGDAALRHNVKKVDEP